jgi:HEAT repeat protein
LIVALQESAVPQEAKKYILRAMRSVATPNAVAELTQLLNGQDPLLKEEARQVLESIPDPKAVAALEDALRKSTGKREKIGLATALGIQKAESSVAVLAPLVVDSDVDIAESALLALARIGGDQATTTLQNANASDKVVAAVKMDVEEALLIASAGDSAIAQELFKSTQFDTVRLAAFRALIEGGPDDAKIVILERAVKNPNPEIRHAALKYGIEMNLPSLQSSLAKAMDQLTLQDRLIVLANIHLLKPAATAEKIALGRVSATEENERIAAITALGRIGTKAAFNAVLQAMGEKSPRINQPASAALASMNYPEAGSALLTLLKDGPSEEKITAIKAVVVRQVPGANEVLIDILTSDDTAASREAMKSLYFTATLDDLRVLVAKAAVTNDTAKKNSLGSINSKIADRIDTDEARALVK